MIAGASKVTRKGQITLPAKLRSRLNIKEGDTVLFDEQDGHISVMRPEDLVDWTSGSLREYAQGRHLEPQEIREIAARAIAEQVSSELET